MGWNTGAGIQGDKLNGIEMHARSTSYCNGRILEMRRRITVVFKVVQGLVQWAGIYKHTRRIYIINGHKRASIYKHKRVGIEGHNTFFLYSNSGNKKLSVKKQWKHISKYTPILSTIFILS